MDNHDLVIPIKGGGVIATDGESRQFGAQVTIYDAHGVEVQTWHYGEWRDDPELVMGAILSVASKTIRTLAVERGDQSAAPSAKSDVSDVAALLGLCACGAPLKRSPVSPRTWLMCSKDAGCPAVPARDRLSKQ